MKVAYGRLTLFPLTESSGPSFSGRSTMIGVNCISCGDAVRPRVSATRD